MKRILSAGVMALVLSSLVAVPEASAQANRYAVVDITNRTGTTVPYSLKWGENGEWRKFGLPHGDSYTHSWQFAVPNQDDSPPLYIAFDSDLKAGVVNRTSYSLQKRAAPGKKFGSGQLYTFDRVGGGSIDLYPRN